MSRGTWVYDKEKRELVDKDEYYRKRSRNSKASDLPSPQVMRDIKPFKNVAVDGKEITSRSQKREMMKQHGLVEVGNEFRLTQRKKPPKTVRHSLKRTKEQLGV